MFALRGCVCFIICANFVVLLVFGFGEFSLKFT
jgi:hypothetical protein